MIRGKSTITRMAYSVLREDHYRVIGKTTGTDARMMYWFTQKEYDVIRNLKVQILVNSVILFCVRLSKSKRTC